jgi:hypothetical protein
MGNRIEIGMLIILTGCRYRHNKRYIDQVGMIVDIKPEEDNVEIFFPSLRETTYWSYSNIVKGDKAYQWIIL